MQQRLTFADRQWIGFWFGLGKSRRQIGQLIRRDHTVVGRELTRNRSQSGYAAESAHAYAERRTTTSHRWQKLGKDPRLKAWVVDRLLEDWSPEQIAGRLETHPSYGLKGKTVSAETVYQFIYSSEGQLLGLWKHLRRRQPQRRPVKTRRMRPTLIRDRTSIWDRPEEATNRTAFGHWESDTVEGRRSRPGGLSVQVERLSRLTHITLLTSKRSEETIDALIRTVERVPRGTVCSVTLDNGPEGARHTVLQKEYEIPTYFCDPYCSWQKGTVENTNGLIRQYFPKQFDPRQTTAHQVRWAEERLNNRPRKILNYQTPNEVFTQLSGALGS